jgi:putative membrane protein
VLQADHTAANEKAIDAAKSVGVTPPDSPNAEQKADNEKKSQKYGGHSSIAISQKVAEYKKASKSADAAGEYAKGNIPVLQKHLKTAKSLASKKTSSR